MDIKDFEWTYPAIIDEVLDGDTVKAHILISHELVLERTIRFNRTQCPELNSFDELERDVALRAKAFVVDRILNKTVKVSYRKVDGFRRWLGEIQFGPELTSMNDLLLAEGLAVPYRRKSK